jgi:hypothetical protein
MPNAGLLNSKAVGSRVAVGSGVRVSVRVGVALGGNGVSVGGRGVSVGSKGVVVGSGGVAVGWEVMVCEILVAVGGAGATVHPAAPTAISAASMRRIRFIFKLFSR